MPIPELTARSDCTFKNIMMDATSLFPRGFHAVRTDFLHEGLQVCNPAMSLTRLAAAPVKYYYIDFWLSVHLAPGAPNLVLGTNGEDRQVPELSWDNPYDPFKVDVFILGNAFRKRIFEVS